MFKNRKIPHWIFLYVVAILLVAGAVNVLMYLAVPTLPDLNAPTWLGFWGSYLGGAIGCIPAIAAYYHGIDESKRQHEETKTDRRLGVMPVFSCRSNALSYDAMKAGTLSSLIGHGYVDETSGLHDLFSFHNKDKYMEEILNNNDNYQHMFLELQNIGFGPALNISLTCSNTSTHCKSFLNGVGAGDIKTLFLSVLIPSESDATYQFQYQFVLSFSDIFGNNYTQTFILQVKSGRHSVGKVSLPTLKKS